MDCDESIAHRHGNAVRCEDCAVYHKRRYLRLYQRDRLEELDGDREATCVDCGVCIMHRPRNTKRCEECAVEYSRSWNLKYTNDRYANDPEYREARKAYGRDYARKRWLDPEYRRKYQEWCDKPENRERIRERNREATRVRAEDPERYQAWLAYRRKYTRERRKRQGGTGYRRNLEKLIADHDNKCGICGEELPEERSDIHVDHIIPVSKNGTNEYNNLQPAHAFCNMSKSNSMMVA